MICTRWMSYLKQRQTYSNDGVLTHWTLNPVSLQHRQTSYILYILYSIISFTECWWDEWTYSTLSQTPPPPTNTHTHYSMLYKSLWVWGSSNFCDSLHNPSHEHEGKYNIKMHITLVKSKMVWKMTVLHKNYL